MSFMFYKCVLVKIIQVKMDKTGHFCIQPDTLTPRRRAPPRPRLLRLGEPEPKFFLNFLVS